MINYAIVSIMNRPSQTNMVVPRKITRHHRVTLPSALCHVVGIEPEGFVTTHRARNDRGVIMIRPCPAPQYPTRSRQPGRARRVSLLGQVVIPAALLNETGLGAGALVGFCLGQAAIRMFAADRLAVLPTPRRFR